MIDDMQCRTEGFVFTDEEQGFSGLNRRRCLQRGVCVSWRLIVGMMVTGCRFPGGERATARHGV